MGSILFCVAHFLKLTTKTDITIQVAVSVSKCLASLRFRSFLSSIKNHNLGACNGGKWLVAYVLRA